MPRHSFNATPQSHFESTMNLVTGYDAIRRSAVVKRWVTLETGKAQSTLAPKPVNPMAALSDPATVRGLLRTYTEKLIALEDENKKMGKRVISYPTIAVISSSALPGLWGLALIVHR